MNGFQEWEIAWFQLYMSSSPSSLSVILYVANYGLQSGVEIQSFTVRIQNRLLIVTESHELSIHFEV